MSYAVKWTYYNKTPNKSNRTQHILPLAFCVLHETAGYGALTWLLRPDVRASYTHIITRDGVVYPYVGTTEFYAWHAGIASSWVNRGTTYVGGQINQASYGVSVEGPNDGTPITSAQRNSLIQLLAEIAIKHNWPLTKEYFPTHAQVAPGYKTDPKGYISADLLRDVEAYRKTLESPITYWTVVLDNANIRQGPATNTAVAGTFRHGESFGARAIVHGERIGGTSEWAWLEDGRGFVHMSLLEPKKERLPLERPLTMLAPPRIAYETFRTILDEGHSEVIHDDPRALYTLIESWGIDPAIALAFFADTAYGTLDSLRDAHNWGNVMTPFNPQRANGTVITPQGVIARYPSWRIGLEDWCERIVRRYGQTMNLTTLEKVQPIYQPFGDTVQAVLAKRQRIEGYIKREIPWTEEGLWNGERDLTPFGRRIRQKQA